jgi:hypothetical protein
MRNDSQYGTTVLIDGFGEDATTSPLSRIPFSKDAAEDAKYSEAWLQHLIMKHPEILPVDQIEPAFADLVAICTELPTPSGFVDNLFVTPTGNLAIIECKLWKNPKLGEKSPLRLSTTPKICPVGTTRSWTRPSSVRRPRKT